MWPRDAKGIPEGSVVSAILSPDTSAERGREDAEGDFGSGSRPVARPGQTPLSDALVHVLGDLGVEHSFGLVGGTIAPFCEALARSAIRVIHCRHESGAAFAAAEASLATDRPAVVFTTSGPGLLNALNGMMAARWEGARVILVSGTTAVTRRGRWAFQETSEHTMPEDLFRPGTLFHYATEILEPGQLDEVADRLHMGVARPEGFVAHVALPSSLQTQPVAVSRATATTRIPPPGLGTAAAERWASAFGKAPPLVWVGFGARRAAASVREFVERTGAGVICSPRGKGIFPEDHPQFIGVSGFAGRSDLVEAIAKHPPQLLLVLGSRLGEFTSFWDRELIPPAGIVHVDIRAEVPGTAMPEVSTHAVHAEIGEFLRSVLEYLPDRRPTTPATHAPELRAMRSDTAPLRHGGPVRPQTLMEAIQRVVVDATDAPLLVDVGNAFAWATNLLRFRSAGRFRVSMGWGSMGQATAGVVGVALTTGRKAFSLVGDGALLMQNEISTAVRYRARAVWIVLNDSQYGMIEQGMCGLRMVPTETGIPIVDFVALARSVGADGVAVRSEPDLDAALRAAHAAEGPFVVDVTIDRSELAPMGRRVRNLIEQGVEGTTYDTER